LGREPRTAAVGNSSTNFFATNTRTRAKFRSSAEILDLLCSADNTPSNPSIQSDTDSPRRAREQMIVTTALAPASSIVERFEILTAAFGVTDPAGTVPCRCCDLGSDSGGCQPRTSFRHSSQIPPRLTSRFIRKQRKHCRKLI
jgi:hypothetical protein